MEVFSKVVFNKLTHTDPPLSNNTHTHPLLIFFGEGVHIRLDPVTYVTTFTDHLPDDLTVSSQCIEIDGAATRSCNTHPPVGWYCDIVWVSTQMNIDDDAICVEIMR